VQTHADAAAAGATLQQPYIRDDFHNRVTLPFESLTSGSMHADILPKYVLCTKSGVDSSSGFFVRARTHTYSVANQRSLVRITLSRPTGLGP